MKLVKKIIEGVEKAFTREPPAAALDLDADGREVLDSTPMQPPVGYRRSPSLSEQIRSMIVSERLKQEAAAAGFETLEEADDFDVGDDFDPSSPYEEQFEPAVDVDEYEQLAKRLAKHLDVALFDKVKPDASPEPQPAPVAGSDDGGGGA